MPVISDAVGTRVVGEPVEIDRRRCLAYAAAIGDTSPVVFDDLREDFIALPQFCVSVEWPLLSDRRLGVAEGCTRQELARAVHVVQDSVFHRPIRPGDRVVTEATIVAIERSRAGARTTTRLDTRHSDGRAVVTSWSSGLLRGVDVEGEDRRIDAPPPVPEPLALADAGTIEISIPKELPHVYSECAAIWNPIHTERSVARAVGLLDVILHGTATWALAGREIIARVAKDEPARLRRLSGRFAATVIPGGSIRVMLRAGRAGDGSTLVRFEVRNGEGGAAIRDGVAVVAAA